MKRCKLLGERPEVARAHRVNNGKHDAAKEPSELGRRQLVLENLRDGLCGVAEGATTKSAKY